jgi:hypothetical protein
MGRRQVLVVRAVLLLIALPLFLWMGVEMSLGILNQARLYKTIDRDSLALIDGYRFFIESATWKGEMLEIMFCREAVERRQLLGAAGALGALTCHFWDSDGIKIPDSDPSGDEKRLDFFLGTSKKEWRSLAIQVPANAEYLAIEYGRRNGWGTKIVRIPPRPIEFSVKRLRRLVSW